MLWTRNCIAILKTMVSAVTYYVGESKIRYITQFSGINKSVHTTILQKVMYFNTSTFVSDIK